MQHDMLIQKVLTKGLFAHLILEGFSSKDKPITLDLWELTWWTTLRVVADQIGNPSWVRMLAEVTSQLHARGGNNTTGRWRERSSLYHLAGAGRASRPEWAEVILKHDPRPEEHNAHQALPALTADFPTPVQRSLRSALNCERFNLTFGVQLSNWEIPLPMAIEP